ncbi:DUF1150 family protein [Pseudosulfitobacter pseudonitzschiae]|uniref:Uncharacterized protein n=1 Tax=Pseudosulfitobacter pseudonitzschiae TaxID=1402135 RepID=A0A073J213_9RHOB|nr:DUF1150 family protein [Pseudosulfitobacter pseudonitzschiae]KEJ96623.1 hypothetical protein SUH3_14800 [Pseudosulfitobacter pseudonitzschiae]MBM1814111.1 DUF1150 family protein [Pseudosulfitobacter pseudonitzschiae]MBM1831104.1 DUF1150 family protein [Pseudosulfitobacter pseudonitzschiae]MBM1835971.1 DUF1150 family protein [Pseudosulfitobacter pseudonitzschiae]MBM1840817.1 DUF1150 family protein [Pseudosulfitobacter pseudonitzschiae]
METPFDTEPKSNIVYVKTIDVSDLPQDVQEQAEGLEHLYAVHDAQGTQLALVADRKMAFVLARQNDLAPQAVH